MKKTTKDIIFQLTIIITLFISTSAFSQVKDAELWTSFQIKKKLSKRISFVFEPSVRLNNNYQNIKKTCFDTGLKYKLNSYLDLEGFYRYSIAEPILDMGNYHRLYTNFEFNYKYSNLRFTVRTRWQTEYKQYFSDREGPVPLHYSRNKIALKYDINRLPFAIGISYEIFNRILAGTKNRMDQSRFKISVEYDYKKRREIEIFYMYQPEKNDKSFMQAHIVGISYSIGLKKWKKKKDKDE